MKKCKKCNHIKVQSEFYNELRNSDGLMGICKKCYNDRAKMRRREMADTRVNIFIDDFEFSKIEKWIPICGYETSYLVSDFGRIKSLPRKRNCGNDGFHTTNIKILKTGVDGTGYPKVTLCYKRIIKKIHVHRLVAQSFLPNPNNYPCVNHKDGNKTNNKVENLEWCSYSYNNFHAYKNNLKNPYLRFGESNPRHKLNKSDIIEIKKMLRTNLSRKSIAEKFGVSKGCIESVKYGQSWNHINIDALR